MSADTNLSIPLEKRYDADGNYYFVAKLKCPVMLDASNGLCFLIFTSSEGDEEMQIAPLTQKKERYNNDRQ